MQLTYFSEKIMNNVLYFLSLVWKMCFLLIMSSEWLFFEDYIFLIITHVLLSP